MFGVANQVMTDFGKMLPDLMITSCFGCYLYEAISRSLISASYLDGQFDDIKTFVVCLCLLQYSPVIVQGFIDDSGRRAVASTNSKIGLANGAIVELLLECSRYLRWQSHQEHTRSRSIKSVHRINMLSNLISKQLHSKMPLLISRQLCAMY